MSLAAQIAEAARKEVEAPEGSGVYWRVRKVVSSDLAKVQVAALRMVFPAAKADQGNDLDAQMKALNRMGDRELDNVSRLTSGVVCAGVTHVRAGSDVWEPIALHMDEAARDAAGGYDAGQLAVVDLPAGVESALYQAISSLHGDAKGAAESLARFRGGSGPLADP